MPLAYVRRSGPSIGGRTNRASARPFDFARLGIARGRQDALEYARRPSYAVVSGYTMLLAKLRRQR